MIEEQLPADDKPAFEVLPDKMTNKRYSLLVYNYLLGQFRIQLTDTYDPDAFAPPGHGSIKREMCTYKKEKALFVLAVLAAAEDPLKVARGFEREHNCEVPGRGRIRLDNEPEVWPAPAEGA
jgi:hypothetical protein